MGVMDIGLYEFIPGKEFLFRIGVVLDIVRP